MITPASRTVRPCGPTRSAAAARWASATSAASAFVAFPCLCQTIERVLHRT